MRTPYWPERLSQLGLQRNSPTVRFVILGALDVLALLVAWLVVLRWGVDTGSTMVLLVAILLATQLLGGYVLSLYRNRYPIGSGLELRWQGVVAAIVLVAGVVAHVLLQPDVGLDWLLLALLTADALMITGRQVLRIWIDHDRRPREADRVVVVGAGQVGSALISQMLRDPASGYLPVALVDDDPAASRVVIDGVPVRGTTEDLRMVVGEAAAAGVIIAIAQAPSRIFTDLIEQLDLSRTWIRTVPPLADLLSADVGLSSIRDLDVSDLIGRTVEDPDTEMITEFIRGRTVLVTGAGGSIGSELCRLIARHEPGRLVMLDRDESALHSLCMTLEGRALMDSPDLALADIRDAEALDRVFTDCRPQIVFHTAALKHLPMLESFPAEGWKTNVHGTLNVLTAARAHTVERFVNISTDKAANPTSNLGRTKFIAERLTASFAESTGLAYVSVRFGNVLGSRGSVLVSFQEQIRRGGPLTVTDPEVTRYFMTIPEACLLVLQAAVEGLGGQALVLDMGAPVRIVDIAQRMMALSGRACPITYTGLRNGEKLHEELFTAEEGAVVLGHTHAWHAAVTPLDPGVLPGPGSSVDEVARFQAHVIDGRAPWAAQLGDTTVDDARSADDVPSSGVVADGDPIAVGTGTGGAGTARHSVATQDDPEHRPEVVGAGPRVAGGAA